MSNSICTEIENDEFYQHFLSDNANIETSNIKNSSVSFNEQINRLQIGIDKLHSELHSQVRQQHGALLSQASQAGKLNYALNAVNEQIQGLQKGAEKLKSQVDVPYSLLENQTKVLERLHETSHNLRQIGRFLQLHRKLQSTKSSSSQATLLFELEPLVENADLNRIDFIRNEMAQVMTARQRLNNFANSELINGLKNGNETQVVESLQIFCNLNTLSKCISNTLTTFVNDIKHSIKECFAGTDVASSLGSKKPVKDVKDSKVAPRGPGKTPTLTTSQNFRSKLWAALEWLFDEEIFGYCNQIISLQKCFANIQTNELIVHHETDIKKSFWKNLEDLLKSSFSDCPTHIGQCLQQDLPKLLAFARGLEVKFGTQFLFSDSVFESLETGYLEKCAINLKAPMAGTDCPTQDAVDNLIRVASNELSAAMVDNRLCLMVAGVFNACNTDFLTKIEAHVKLGTDTVVVVDIPNASQLQNTSLANIVYLHNDAVRKMIQSLGTNFVNTSAAEKITDDLTKGKNLILAIMQQLIESMHSAVNIILLSMHREPGLNSERPISAGPSLYMKELHDFLLRTWNLHISPFADKQSVDNCGKELAGHCIELFARNVAIIRPISVAGRNRLKNDCFHLEAAIKPMISDPSTLGKPYRLLRALSSVLVLSPEELSNQPIESGSPISPYIVLYLLFGYADSDLQSPHTSAGWTNEKLLQWLDGHTSDKERLELVSGALQKYRTIVRQKSIAQYDPVYPIISNFLEKFYRTIAS
ncbi:conserved oligomeric Golgi complex subunit 5 [Bradysia coprophila]|uniref:conserved oligomeric Golgi complex subunit 5 n=1 Tax=Bradysia coprophila TaxID=38358 RepID=UPI00187D7794|nr:conserved oligomeric Golgi complex subunit 5 [Bradysia coprophila]